MFVVKVRQRTVICRHYVNIHWVLTYARETVSAQNKEFAPTRAVERARNIGALEGAAGVVKRTLVDVWVQKTDMVDSRRQALIF